MPNDTNIRSIKGRTVPSSKTEGYVTLKYTPRQPVLPVGETTMDTLTWTCMVCGDTRPDNRIDVHTEDTSAQYNLPPGTMKVNVRYCIDRAECRLKARDHNLLKKDR